MPYFRLGLNEVLTNGLLLLSWEFNYKPEVPCFWWEEARLPEKKRKTHEKIMLRPSVTMGLELLYFVM